MDGKMFGSLTPLLLMLIIFYFLLYRPQKKAQNRRKSLLDALQVGHQVITIGGIHGEIKAIDENEKVIYLEIAPNPQVRVAIPAIQSNLTTNQSL